MNAQEAIELTKHELEEHLLLVKYYESQLPEDDKELIRFKSIGEALSIVLELAEKQEQAYIERMLLESNCEFCRGNHKHIMRQEIENYEDYDNDVCTIKIDEENYLCFEDSYHAHQQEVMFCPMCGRNLREGADE